MSSRWVNTSPISSFGSVSIFNFAGNAVENEVNLKGGWLVHARPRDPRMVGPVNQENGVPRGFAGISGGVQFQLLFFSPEGFGLRR